MHAFDMVENLYKDLRGNHEKISYNSPLKAMSIDTYLDGLGEESLYGRSDHTYPEKRKWWFCVFSKREER